MSDRRSVRALGLRALDVDVDPLVIAGQIRELVDHRLCHLVPLARPHELTHERAHVVDAMGDRLGDARVERHVPSPCDRARLVQAA